MTFTFPVSCSPQQAIHAVAYLGSFDPSSPCTNYLGDFGHNVDVATTGLFSVNVPPNSIVVLVVHELGVIAGCGYSFSVTGLPTCPPTGGCTLTCSGNIGRGTDPGVCGAVVSYPPPDASGQCGAITCDPPSGGFFPKGSTTVTCTESNSSSTCSFTVTVSDNQPPVINCPGIVTAATSQNTCSASGSAVVTYTTPTAVDVCSGAVPVTCTPPSGSTFAVGTTTVGCVASDQNVNIGFCSFPVIVFDTCLQDDSNSGTVLLINTTTGDYRFCCGGTTFTGKGTVSRVGCVISLQHNAIDRRVSARVDKSQFKGSATLQNLAGAVVWSITDRDIRNNSCSCH